MSFLRLICISRKIERRKNALISEKDNSYKQSQGLETNYTLNEKVAHKRLRCHKRVTKLCKLPEKSCLRRTLVKLKYNGTIENYILKSIIGFISGFLLTYLFFMFFILLLNFKLSTATIMCSVVGCTLTIGLAFSYKVRCIVLLLLPQFFTKRGRQALLAYAFILAITGPAKNTLHNMGILSESLACGQEQLKDAVRQIIDVIKKPFYAVKDALKSVVKTVKEVVKKIKDVLLTIRRIILSLLKVIKSAFEFLGKVINFCNKKVGTPYERCVRVFEEALSDCNAKLGPMFNWLCSITYLAQSVCYLVKVFDYVCMLIDFISDSIIGVVKRKLKTFVRHVKTMFYVRIKFSHSFAFETNQTQNISSVTGGMLTEIRQRTEHIIAVFDVMSCATSLFFVFILIKALYYRYKYLTNERFDNHFITRSFREIDFTRATQFKETVLPLNHRERHSYIVVGSLRLIKSEKRAFCKAAVILSMVTVKLLTHMMADYALYWMLTLVRYHAKFQSPVEAPNLPTLHVAGDGLLADLLRSIVKAFQPLGLNLQIDTVPCLPDPIPPDYDRYFQIAFLLLLCWLLVIVEPYGLRLRHWVMCYYHPDRARERSVWLYNHILRSRSSFLKFARRQLRRKVMGNKNVTKVTCREYLRARIPCKCVRLLLCLGSDHQDSCLLCGEVFRDVDINPPVYCQTPDCPGKYCAQCFLDLQNKCTVCLDPLQYGDLSDISQEKDSSDEDKIKPLEKLESPTKKKPRNKFIHFKKRKSNKDREDDNDGNAAQQRLIQHADNSASSSNLNTTDRENAFHITSSDTDYSYSYQREKNFKSPITESVRVQFLDVEKQYRPDYASMRTFRDFTSSERLSRNLPRFGSGEQKFCNIEEGFCYDDSSSSSTDDDTSSGNVTRYTNTYSMDLTTRSETSSSSFTPPSIRRKTRQMHFLHRIKNRFSKRKNNDHESIALLDRNTQAELMLDLSDIINQGMTTPEVLSSGNNDLLTKTSTSSSRTVLLKHTGKAVNVNSPCISTFAKHDNPDGNSLTIVEKQHHMNVQCLDKSNRDTEAAHKNKNDVISALNSSAQFTDDKTRTFGSVSKTMPQYKRTAPRTKSKRRKTSRPNLERCSCKSDCDCENDTSKRSKDTNVVSKFFNKFSVALFKKLGSPNYSPLHKVKKDRSFPKRISTRKLLKNRPQDMESPQTTPLIDNSSDTSSVDSEILFQLENKRSLIPIPLSPLISLTNLPEPARRNPLANKFTNVCFAIVDETPRSDGFIKTSPISLDIHNKENLPERKFSKDSHLYDSPCTETSSSITIVTEERNGKNLMLSESTTTYKIHSSCNFQGDSTINKWFPPMITQDKKSGKQVYEEHLKKNFVSHQKVTTEKPLPSSPKRAMYKQRIKDYYAKIAKKTFDNPVMKKDQTNKCINFISKMFQKKKIANSSFLECELTSNLLENSSDSTSSSSFVSSHKPRKRDFISSSSSSSLSRYSNHRFPRPLDCGQRSSITVDESLMGQSNSTPDNQRHMRGGSDIPISTYLDRSRLHNQAVKPSTIHHKPLQNEDLLDTDSSLSADEPNRHLNVTRVYNPNKSAPKSKYVYSNSVAQEEYQKEIAEENKVQQRIKPSTVNDSGGTGSRKANPFLATNLQKQATQIGQKLKEVEKNLVQKAKDNKGLEESVNRIKTGIDNIKSDISFDFKIGVTPPPTPADGNSIDQSPLLIDSSLPQKLTALKEDLYNTAEAALLKLRVNKTNSPTENQINLKDSPINNQNQSSEPPLPTKENTPIQNTSIPCRRPASEPVIRSNDHLPNWERDCTTWAQKFCTEVPNNEPFSASKETSCCEEIPNNTDDRQRLTNAYKTKGVEFCEEACTREIPLFAREPPERDISSATSFEDMRNSDYRHSYTASNSSQGYDYDDHNYYKCPNESLMIPECESANYATRNAYSPCMNPAQSCTNRHQTRAHSPYCDNYSNWSHVNSELSMEYYPDYTTSNERWSTDNQCGDRCPCHQQDRYTDASKGNQFTFSAESHGAKNIAHYRNNYCIRDRRSSYTPRDNFVLHNDQGSQSNLEDFAYQGRDEYNTLVNELGEKLIIRNKEKVQKTLEEFEKHSRENRNIKKPIFEDCEANEGKTPRSTCRHGQRSQSYPLRQNSCRNAGNNAPPVPPHGLMYGISKPAPPVPPHNYEDFNKETYGSHAVQQYQELHQEEHQHYKKPEDQCHKNPPPVPPRHCHRASSSPRSGFVQNLAKHMDPNSPKTTQKYPKFSANVTNSHWELNCNNEWVKVGGDDGGIDKDFLRGFDTRCHQQSVNCRRRFPITPPRRVSSLRRDSYGQQSIDKSSPGFEQKCKINSRNHSPGPCRCKHCPKSSSRY